MEETIINTLPRELIKELAFLDEGDAFSRGEEDIKVFAREILGIDLNPFQERVADHINNWWVKFKGGEPEFLNFLLDTGNRVGKTTWLAVIHIWFLYYKKGIDRSNIEYWRSTPYNTFNLSPVSRQAKNLIDYIEAIIGSNFAWQKDGKRFVNKCKIPDFIERNNTGDYSINHQLGEIRFCDNRMLVCVSTGQDKGASTQGSACGLMTYDECVQSHHLREELEGPKLRSRLGDYGVAFGLVSTPDENAPGQPYYFKIVKGCERAVKAGTPPDYIVIKGRYQENIFINERQQKMYIAETAKNETQALQILEGAFISSGTRMFPLPVITQMNNGKKQASPPLDGHLYVVSADWAVSDKGDETIMYVVDYTDMELFLKPAEIVKEFAVQGGDPWLLMSTYKNLCLEYGRHANSGINRNDEFAENVMDTGAMGGVMFKKMLRELHPHSFEGGEMKKEALTALNLMLTYKRKHRIIASGELVEDNPNFGLLRSYELPFLDDELSGYKVEDEKLKQDRVMALAMICRFLWKRYKDRFEGKVSRPVTRLNPFKQPNYLIRT